MTTFSQRAAVALVRAWTSLYTSGAPPVLRERRRSEIESDLWESLHDHAPTGRTLSLFAISSRLVLGIPDDLVWRAAHTLPRTRRIASITLTAAAAACIVGTLWLYEQLRALELPVPPNKMNFVAAPPPPPERAVPP
jgi:hypothetical protein